MLHGALRPAAPRRPDLSDLPLLVPTLVAPTDIAETGELKQHFADQAPDGSISSDAHASRARLARRRRRRCPTTTAASNAGAAPAVAAPRERLVPADVGRLHLVSTRSQARSLSRCSASLPSPRPATGSPGTHALPRRSAQAAPFSPCAHCPRGRLTPSALRTPLSKGVGGRPSSLSPNHHLSPSTAPSPTSSSLRFHPSHSFAGRRNTHPTYPPLHHPSPYVLSS